MAQPRQPTTTAPQDRDSLIRRSWHAMADLFSPFSPSALASLPQNLPRPTRYTRDDAIPETHTTDGEQPTVRDYHAIHSVPEEVTVRVPKKIASPIRVEGKVWFANERSKGLTDIWRN
jgi:hypothetical protein